MGNVVPSAFARVLVVSLRRFVQVNKARDDESDETPFRVPALPTELRCLAAPAGIEPATRCSSIGIRHVSRSFRFLATKVCETSQYLEARPREGPRTPGLAPYQCSLAGIRQDSGSAITPHGDDGFVETRHFTDVVSTCIRRKVGRPILFLCLKERPRGRGRKPKTFSGFSDVVQGKHSPRFALLFVGGDTPSSRRPPPTVLFVCGDTRNESRHARWCQTSIFSISPTQWAEPIEPLANVATASNTASENPPTFKISSRSIACVVP